jgi:hypothetical protein
MNSNLVIFSADDRGAALIATCALIIGVRLACVLHGRYAA